MGNGFKKCVTDTETIYEKSAAELHNGYRRCCKTQKGDSEALPIIRGPATPSLVNMQQMSVAGSSGGIEVEDYLQETYDKIGNTLVLVKNAAKRTLAEIRRGEDVVLEVTLDDRNSIVWSGASERGGTEGEPYATVLHPETKFVRVIRASEGRLTTWRCYRRRPPEPREQHCTNGHTLQKTYGTSGMMRMIERLHICKNCGREIRKGGIRWVCPEKGCDFDLCCSCVEVMSQPGGMTALAAAQLAKQKAANEAARSQAIVEQQMADDKGFSVALGSQSQDTSTAASSPSPTPRPPTSSSTPRTRGVKGAEASTPEPTPVPTSAATAAPDSAPAQGVWAKPKPRTAPPPATSQKPTAQQKADAAKRLKRLISHGDLDAAERQLEVAKKLEVNADEVKAAEDQLQALKNEGGFLLLSPKG